MLDDKLVRGLDYYSDTVFEWITDSLGAQGTVCAGGRYDGLVSQLGGESVPAVGFALGIERLAEMLPNIQAERHPARLLCRCWRCRPSSFMPII